MENRKTVCKWFCVWNFDKEEIWLNNMANQGWILDGVGYGRYTFFQCDSTEYTVRLEMHNFDKNYIDFMRETGAEYVERIGHWIYFRKKASDGEFNLFSDIDSKINHLNRIGKMLSIIGIANLIIGLTNSFNDINIGWVNLLCATLLMYGLGRIHGKKEALLKVRTLQE